MTETSISPPGFSAKQWQQIRSLAVSLTPDQALWMSGYLAGVGHQARATGGLLDSPLVPPAAPSVVQPAGAAARNDPRLIETLLGQLALSADAPVAVLNRGSGLRLDSMACVAFPTCGLAMAESERYLPGFHGQRLNKMHLENVGEAAILAALDKVLGHYARDRKAGEHFGDFAIRAGYVAEVKEGRHLND